MKLVTGGNGLLGSHIVLDLLEKGHEVRALKRENSNLRYFDFLMEQRFGAKALHMGQKLHWENWQIGDVERFVDCLSGIDAVYHCAAVVSFNRSDRDRMMKANVAGTAEVVNTILSCDKEIVLCHVSSTSALGKSKTGVTDETVEFDRSEDHSYYGWTKHLAELEIERGRQEGLRAAIINPGVIIGFTDPNRGSGQVIGQILKGIPFTSSGSNAVVYVRDVSAAAIQLVEDELLEGRYLCVAEHQSFTEQKLLLQEVFSLRKRVIELPDVLIKAAGSVSALLDRMGVSVALSPEITRSAISHSRFDNTRIIRDLRMAFTPMREAYAAVAELFHRFEND